MKRTGRKGGKPIRQNRSDWRKKVIDGKKTKEWERVK